MLKPFIAFWMDWLCCPNGAANIGRAKYNMSEAERNNNGLSAVEKLYIKAMAEIITP